MGIERFITPLTYFRYAGGSVHCLTNEIYGGCNPHGWCLSVKQVFL